MKTFEEIVPKWSEKLKRGYANAREPCIIDGQVLDISKYQVCIAGEAWMFRKSKLEKEGISCVYSHGGEEECEPCIWYANEFDNRLADLEYAEGREDKTDLKEEEARFNLVKERFVVHWNEQHENI